MLAFDDDNDDEDGDGDEEEDGDDDDEEEEEEGDAEEERRRRRGVYDNGDEEGNDENPNFPGALLLRSLSMCVFWFSCVRKQKERKKK